MRIPQHDISATKGEGASGVKTLRLSRPKVKTLGDLLARTEKRGDCFVYNRGKAHRYGMLVLNGNRTTAQRAAYTLAFGAIPPGMNVCHKCDVPRCANPEHLFLGTQQDNMTDKVAKGRANGPRRFLTKTDAQQIKSLWRDLGFTQAGIAAAFNVTLDCVHKIINGKRHANA